MINISLFYSVSRRCWWKHGLPSWTDMVLLSYLLPSSFLFDRSCKLLNLVLNVMGSLINGNSSSLLPGYHIRYAKGNSSRINAIVSVLLWMQQGMLRFSKFSIHTRKRLTIFHEAYARYRYNFASQVSHVHIRVLCFSVYVLQ